MSKYKHTNSEDEPKDNDIFHPPYQFVPVTGTVNDSPTSTLPYDNIKTGTDNFVRHDLWHKEGYSGRITCTLHLHSPTFVGNSMTQGNKEPPTSGIGHYQRNGQPAFPGSSLRGMVGSLIESLSQSSLRVLEDQDYSVRQQVGDAHNNLGVIVGDGKQHPFKMRPLKFTKIPCKKARQFCTEHGIDALSNEVVQKFCKEHRIDAPDSLPTDKLKLLILNAPSEALPHNRENERFAYGFDNENRDITIANSAVDDYETLYRQCYERTAGQPPQLPFVFKQSRLSDDKEPWKLRKDLCLYYTTENNKISQLSTSQIWRSLAKHSTYELFGPNLLPFGAHRDELTPAEQLLGVVEAGKKDTDHTSRNLASRVRFSDAVPKNKVKVKEMNEVTLKILASPKPPSPAMYFHPQDKQGDYLSKKDFAAGQPPPQPNGRKYYLHHRQDIEQHPWKSNNGENSQLKMRIKPLESNQEFTFQVSFDNLSVSEWHLLNTALVPDENYRHRLGLGKSLGLGSVKVEIEKIEIEKIEMKSKQRYSCENWKEFWQNPVECPNPESSLVDKKTLKTLQVLGNPECLQYEVRPPLLSEQLSTNQRETRTYNWFVKNDLGNRQNWQRQALKGIYNDVVPTLRSDWNNNREEDKKYIKIRDKYNQENRKTKQNAQKQQEAVEEQQEQDRLATMTEE